jgi:microcystin-dependent protein
MPISHVNPTTGTESQIPNYPEAADGPKAFADFADSIDFFFVPIGAVVPYAGETLPSAHWLFCDGSEVNIADYPQLHSVLNGRFGATGATFNVPNMKGRVPFGRDGQSTQFATMGQSGGSLRITDAQTPLKQHTHGATLTINQATQSHSHNMTTSSEGHAHPGNFVTNVTVSSNVNTSGGGSLTRVSSVGVDKRNMVSEGHHAHAVTAGNADTSHTHAGSVAIDNASAAATDDYMQPYLTLNYIIRAL